MSSNTPQTWKKVTFYTDADSSIIGDHVCKIGSRVSNLAIENIVTDTPQPVEVITRYERGAETHYSLDGGETWITETEFKKRKPLSDSKETQP